MTTSNEIITWGRETLQSEMSSLGRTAETLGQPFADAVNEILSSEGKVVVSGLGKSGHIARKMSATLASTGTPAFFLHPAEALHGDLGMMDAKDVLIAIAFGGETHETVEVAKAARRIGQKVIALTGKPTSSLASLGDIVIDGSVREEACPLNLAPTNSTTVALALGDALAVALMKARGFREKDFAQFHPGGALGRRLSLVVDHMRQLPLMLQETETFERILEVITHHNYGIAGVMDAKGALIGAISDGDLRRALMEKRSEVFQLKASDFVKGKPRTIDQGALAVDALRFMESHSISSLFVENSKGSTVGLVRMYDLLAAKIV